MLAPNVEVSICTSPPWRHSIRCVCSNAVLKFLTIQVAEYLSISVSLGIERCLLINLSIAWQTARPLWWTSANVLNVVLVLLSEEEVEVGVQLILECWGPSFTLNTLSVYVVKSCGIVGIIHCQYPLSSIVKSFSVYTTGGCDWSIASCVEL